MLSCPGAEDSLYMLDIMEEELFQFSEKDMKRVIQIRVLSDEGLVVILAGQCQSVLHCLLYVYVILFKEILLVTLL